MSVSEQAAFAFWSKVTPQDSGCWHWTGAKIKADSYGSFRIDGKAWGAHRFAFLLCVGDIPEGLFACHRCNNKGCVNPAHLYVATNQQNIQDAARDGLLANQHSKKVCCPTCGGPYSYTSDGTRKCNACRRRLNRESAIRLGTYRPALPIECDADMPRDWFAVYDSGTRHFVASNLTGNFSGRASSRADMIRQLREHLAARAAQPQETSADA